MANTRHNPRKKILLWGVTSSHDILSRDEVPWNVMDTYSIELFPMLWGNYIQFEGVKAILTPINGEPTGWSTLDEDLDLMFKVYGALGEEE